MRALILLVFLAVTAGTARAAEPAAPQPTPRVGAWGFDLSGLDRAAKPGDDFYRYAVGAYLDRIPIPSDLGTWNPLAELSVKAEEDVRRAVEKAAAARPARGTIEQKVVDAYGAYLDAAKIEALGLAPFEADLELLAGLATHEDVAAAVARPGLRGNSPIVVFPTVDAKDPARYALAVAQAGLGLPSRDFYLSDAAAFVQIRARYRDYVERMLTLARVPGAADAATAVVAVETRIAGAHWPLERARDKDQTYNPKTLAQLVAFAPGFPWESVLAGAGLAGRDRFVVQEADAIRDLARIFGETPVSTWRAYLTFHYLNAQADIMPTAFDAAQFDFFGKTVSGLGEQRDRWKRAVNEISGPYGAGPLGEAVGRLYVAEHFPAEAKQAILALVRNLLAAYQKRIANLAWMSPETRAVAIRKAQTVRVKIGFPDKWKDYSALQIEPGDAYGNRKRISVFEWERLTSRLDAPTDKDEWAQGPQTVNAYYRADFNEIAFPAAILQAPLFDPAADPAVNYGGIGGVIGHEMGHGYDDQGAKSDEHGVLRKWWQPADEERFAALTRALAAQYSSYSPLAGMHVNGDATSGENIGDLGGLSVALEAYQMSLAGRPAPVLDGTTGLQRFFLAWAQVWRCAYRDEYLRQILTSDVHSPMMYRVNGVVRNIDAWYEAFDVRPGDRLYLAPEARVRIW